MILKLISLFSFSIKASSEWRIIALSIPRASKVFKVSRRVSPFEIELLSELKFKTWAPSLLAAISKENFVLVEFSKNRFAITFP